jgi:hypothetical protein
MKSRMTDLIKMRLAIRLNLAPGQSRMVKPCLREMIVVGEDFDDPFGKHRIRGYAIGAAVALVRAGFVEG